MNIAVAGTGYVGLSLAVLLSQKHHVTAVDILPEKVEKINRRESPIQDEYIERYLREKELDLTATLDAESAYRDAELVIIAAPDSVYGSHIILGLRGGVCAFIGRAVAVVAVIVAVGAVVVAEIVKILLIAVGVARCAHEHFQKLAETEELFLRFRSRCRSGLGHHHAAGGE